MPRFQQQNRMLRKKLQLLAEFLPAFAYLTMKLFQRIFILFSFLFVSISDSQLVDIFNIVQQIFNNNSNNNFSDNKSYDFIIVGAGSAGSVVANRLSENKNWNVLLLEAGSNENFFTDVPLMAAFQSATRYNWGYKSEKSNTSCLSLKNHRCNVPRGKALGGTSVINLLIYSRGNKLDFDEWKNVGNTGWSYEDVLPYFIKSENCSSDIEADAAYRGRKGYLNVQYAPFHTPLPKKFIKAGVDYGYKNTDPNGHLNVGFSKVQATMYEGRRQSAAKAFLKPVRKRPNLNILTEARVTKILLDAQSKRAYGVEFIRNRIKYQLKASKEVLICAGAINTPQLLMLSGIGPREDLERFKIPVVQNLRVGYNLQDHVSFVQTFLVNESVTISDLGVQSPSHVLNYVLNGKGPMTIPGGAEALAFIKTKFSTNRNDDYPDIELVLGAGGFNNDFYGSLRNLFGVSNNLFYQIYGPVLFTPAFSISTVLLKPRSKGRVTIRDSSPLRSPAIHLNYFEDESDMQVMIEGLKVAQMIGESPSFHKYNSSLYKISIKGCKHLRINTDRHRACLIRNLATTLGHQVGTCKMGPPNDPYAVVDSQLRVYGISGLRVIDGSIMPNIVAGHTNSVIMMIGEKASDMIKKTWKNK